MDTEMDNYAMGPQAQPQPTTPPTETPGGPVRYVPIVTYALIAANVAMYVLTTFAPSDSLFQVMVLVPTDVLGTSRLWSLLTSMFLHVNVSHLMANMLSLYAIGPACEREYGRRTYLASYMAGGIVGGITFAAVRLVTGQMATAVGASGAIFSLLGMQGAILLTLMRAARSAVGGDGTVPQPISAAWTRYLTLLGLNLFVIPLAGRVAWEAHVGGLVTGFAIGMLSLRRRLSAQMAARSS